MPYAAITKKIVKSVNKHRTEKLKTKLGRELYPNEIVYTEHEFITYISIVKPKSSDYVIRKTRVKDEAIFYLENELPYVKHILKGKSYSIIDVKTNVEVERLPAAINIALTPETIGDMSCSIQL